MPLPPPSRVARVEEKVMKVMTENDTPHPRISRYQQAGSPLSCFLPSCRKPFLGTCVHANDGHFYCSGACADEGAKLDLTRVEDFKRSRA